MFIFYVEYLYLMETTAKPKRWAEYSPSMTKQGLNKAISLSLKKKKDYLKDWTFPAYRFGC